MSIRKVKTEHRNKDTALALGFASILLFLWKGTPYALHCGLGFLLIGMLFPNLLKPVASFWFGLGEFLGKYMSKMILFVVYIVIISPVALLKRSHWQQKFFPKKDLDSNLVWEDQEFKKEDLNKPY